MVIHPLYLWIFSFWETEKGDKKIGTERLVSHLSLMKKCVIFRSLNNNNNPFWFYF